MNPFLSIRVILLLLIKTGLKKSVNIRHYFIEEILLKEKEGYHKVSLQGNFA